MISRLVFPGGGVNSIALAGAASVLKKRGHLERLVETYGVSGGSFAALGPVLNFQPQDYHNLVYDTDFIKFLGSSGIFYSLMLFKKRLGFFNGKYICDTVNAQIKKHKGLDEPATFEQLHEKSQIGFNVVVTNKSQEIIKIFSHKKTPKARVDLAIQASMAFPFILETVIVKEDENGNYIYNDKGMILADGGLICNFPLALCDVESKKTDPNYNPDETVGFYLAENKHHQQWIENQIPPPHQKFYFIEWLIKSIKLLFYSQQHDLFLDEKNVARTQCINMDNLFQFNFWLGKNGKKARLAAGEEAGNQLAERLEQKLAHQQIEEEVLLEVYGNNLRMEDQEFRIRARL